MKRIYLMLIALVSNLALAQAQEPRMFQLEIRELTNSGTTTFVSTTVQVNCNNPVPVSAKQEMTYPANPPQPGPKLEFNGEFLLSQCAKAK